MISTRLNSYRGQFYLMILAVLLAACGSAPEVQVEAQAPDNEPAAEEPTEEPEPTPTPTQVQFDQIDVSQLVATTWWLKLPGSISLESGAREWYLIFREDGMGSLRESPEMLEQALGDGVAGYDFKWTAENGTLSITPTTTSGESAYCEVGDLGIFQVTTLDEEQLRMKAIEDPCLNRNTYFASGAKWLPFVE